MGGVHKRVCYGSESSGSNMGRIQKDEEEGGHEEDDWGKQKEPLRLTLDPEKSSREEAIDYLCFR